MLGWLVAPTMSAISRSSLLMDPNKTVKMSASVPLHQDQTLHQLGFGLYLLFLLSSSLYTLIYTPTLTVSRHLGDITSIDGPRVRAYRCLWPLAQSCKALDRAKKSPEEVERDLLGGLQSTGTSRAMALRNIVAGHERRQCLKLAAEANSTLRCIS